MERASHALASMVFLTALSGAFVAGLDAGLIYNQFPKMGDGLVPSDLISPYIQPLWRNIFENPAAVQFQHRVLAVSSYAGIVVMWLWSRRYRTVLPRNVNAGLHVMLGVATAQVTLGISTLLWMVPVPLAFA